MVNNLPRVCSLSREDPLEKGMATPPLFLPGEFHGQRSLVVYSLWGHIESDTTVHGCTHECYLGLS